MRNRPATPINSKVTEELINNINPRPSNIEVKIDAFVLFWWIWINSNWLCLRLIYAQLQIWPKQ